MRERILQKVLAKGTALLMLAVIFAVAPENVSAEGQDCFVFHPEQAPGDQGFVATWDSDESMSVTTGNVMRVIDSSAGAKLVFTYEYSGGIPDGFELQASAGADGAAGITFEDMGGGIKDSGIRVGFTDGTYAYLASMIERNATRQVALLQGGGYSEGVSASWDNGWVDFAVRKTASGAELVVGETTIAVSNLALPPAGRPNPTIEFGAYSPVAQVHALFKEISAGQCPSSEVYINIKPGSFPNSINTCSGGNTPVTIWGSDFLDVNTIDPDQLILASASVKTVGKSDRTLCSIEDVGAPSDTAFDNLNPEPDGFLDLTCHFLTIEMTDLDDTSTRADFSITGCDYGSMCQPDDSGYYQVSTEDSVNIVKDCE